MTVHPQFDPDTDRVVRVANTEAPPPEEELPPPYQLAAQLPLFKAGMLGSAVTIWSKAEGTDNPYPATALCSEGDTALVIRVTDDDAEQAILFAAGYIYGWHESLGGQAEDLDIWLERHKPS